MLASVRIFRILLVYLAAPQDEQHDLPVSHTHQPVILIGTTSARNFHKIWSQKCGLLMRLIPPNYN
jgi:hypothetical protein